MMVKRLERMIDDLLKSESRHDKSIATFDHGSSVSKAIEVKEPFSKKDINLNKLYLHDQKMEIKNELYSNVLIVHIYERNGGYGVECHLEGEPFNTSLCMKYLFLFPKIATDAPFSQIMSDYNPQENNNLNGLKIIKDKDDVSLYLGEELTLPYEVTLKAVKELRALYSIELSYAPKTSINL